MNINNIYPNVKNHINDSYKLVILEKRLIDIEIEVESIIKSNAPRTDQLRTKLRQFLSQLSDIEEVLKSQSKYLIENNLEVKPEINRFNQKINSLKKNINFIRQIDNLNSLAKALKK